ncbi:MAG TPA: CBS domain-containing protein [Bacillota bacterium]|nr:CBS domain-containing protein [Bacillota bacterium]
MNIAFMLRPKKDVAFLYSDFTLRQGLEKMRHHGYTAIPVIDREGRYITTISEGDILWFILDRAGKSGNFEDIPIKDIETIRISDVLHPDKNPPASITSSAEELASRAMEQNFIPVIDDSGSFIGMVTRRDIIKTFIVAGELEK